MHYGTKNCPNIGCVVSGLDACTSHGHTDKQKLGEGVWFFCLAPVLYSCFVLLGRWLKNTTNVRFSGRKWGGGILCRKESEKSGT